MHDTAHTPNSRDIVEALHLAGAAPRRVLELDVKARHLCETGHISITCGSVMLSK